MIAEKFVWSQVSPLIELHVSAVLFCFVLSSWPNHAEFRTWKIEMPLSQVKLFKPPVVRETISIIQKTFLPSGVFLPYKSNKNIAAPWDLLYEFKPLIDSSRDLRRDSCILKAKLVDQSQPTTSRHPNCYAARKYIWELQVHVAKDNGIPRDEVSIWAIVRWKLINLTG